ncbi:MAG TPA: hypothetical protein VJP80_01530 [Candidatus Saccharimonadales bacterium]|nr:hypothetical protein [Candidatus Saccharimonadales bacterium]
MNGSNAGSFPERNASMGNDARLQKALDRTNRYADLEGHFVLGYAQPSKHEGYFQLELLKLGLTTAPAHRLTQS